MTILLCGTKTDFLSRARECVVNQRKEAHDSCTNQPDTTLAVDLRNAYGGGGFDICEL